MDGLDHFCKEVLRAKGYVRYVDDFALFHDDPKQLVTWRDHIAHFLQGRRLCLHPEKTEIVETKTPTTFLGFWALCSYPTDTGGCQKPMYVAFAIGCGVCATAGDRVILHVRKWSRGYARGSRMRKGHRYSLQCRTMLTGYVVSYALSVSS